MNLNNMIEKIASQHGLECEEDEYCGKAEKYMVYTYEDEKPALYGDNQVLADTAYIQIQIVCPKNYNYHSLKKKVRNALEQVGFSITTIKNFLGNDIYGTKKMRQIVFQTEYTEGRED